MITIEKAALAEIGAIREYMKRDANGNAVMNEMGQPVMGGHYRQVVFQGPGMKADLIPITLFHDDARAFEGMMPGTQGTLQFRLTKRQFVTSTGEQGVSLEAEFINFL